MSRRRVLGIAALLAALAVTALGLSGAYAYGNNYNIHRGFNQVAQAKGAGRGRLLTERFYSPAMHKQVYYLVYLPPGYTPTRRYPVYYLLHGEPSRPRVFVQVAGMPTRLDDLMYHHESRAMILVFPNGQIDNDYFSDSEWANTPSGDFESYVLEVVHHVDDTFSTIRSRNARVLAGFSMGGYGAMNIGLHHLNVFGDIQSWSGYYIETHNGVFAHATPQTMFYNSPGQQITRLRRQIHRFPLNVFMYVGDHDPDAPQQPYMADSLRDAGVHVADRLYAGGHDWDIWWPHIDNMIELASYDVGHPPTRTALTTTRIVPVPARFGAIAPPSHHHRRVVRAAVVGHDAHHVVKTEKVVTRYTPSGGRYRQLITVTSPAPRSRHPTLRLIGALLLALVASALINLGFVLQHRGHASSREAGSGRMRDVFTRPSWLLGQLVGWAGWGGQIVAVALVPLTLVQAVGAGSLALSVPLAAWLFEYRVTRGQMLAIGAIALSLSSLPVGAGTHGSLSDGLLIGIALLLSLVAAISCLSRATAVRATAAGVLYGVADAAVKADAISLHNAGLTGLLSGWTVVAALATLGGFLAFQAALRGHDAVQPLSLMAALSAVTGVVIGVAAFREPLGSDLVAGVVHVAAIAVVLVCVPVLVRAQQQLVREDRALAAHPAHAGGGDSADASAARADDALAPRRARAFGPRIGAASPAGRTVAGSGLAARGLAMLRARLSWQLPLRIAVGTVTRFGALILTIVCAVAGVGLLYSLRGLGALGLGPSIRDSLPLLQLAGFDGQPLVRVLVAFIIAGLALGILLQRFTPASRMLVVAPVAALLLLVVSDASYALSNNIGFFPVLAQRGPPLGPWLEWLMLVLAAALPGLREANRRAATNDPLRRPVEAMPA